MWLIYDLIIHLYGDAISIASLFNPKAKKWVAGRKAAPSLTPSPNWGREGVGATAWFHCASLGEFEQGRPVIDAFRKQHPDWKIVLTFFSPSGYEVRKNYEGADFIFYLPLDTPWNARKFISLIKPSLVIFVKYEFWFHYLDILYKEKIPVYIVSAIFRKDQHFFRWYGGWAKKQLKKVTGFFVQDEASAELLRTNGIGQVTVSGDTRFDRVAAIAVNAKSFPLVEKFAGNSPVFLAGSTWPADEELIFKLIDQVGDRVKLIIAPHEVHRARIEALRDKIPNSKFQIPNKNQIPNSGFQIPDSVHGTILFSELTVENAASAGVLIVDGIGFLSHLYQYATIAYIGGGFGVGIHNILEAATFGKPVIFGPNYRKFREAVELIEAGGAFSIDDSQQLNNRTIELLDNKESLARSSGIAASYVQQKKGATGVIISSIT